MGHQPATPPQPARQEAVEAVLAFAGTLASQAEASPGAPEPPRLTPRAEASPGLRLKPQAKASPGLRLTPAPAAGPTLKSRLKVQLEIPKL